MVEILGVDGCVMAVVGDILKDPQKERKFMDALASNSDGIPPHIVAIKAINTTYNAKIPKLGSSDLGKLLRGPVGEYLDEYLGCKLPVYPGIELTFLQVLAQTAERRLAIIKKYPIKEH